MKTFLVTLLLAGGLLAQTAPARPPAKPQTPTAPVASSPPAFLPPPQAVAAAFPTHKVLLAAAAGATAGAVFGARALDFSALPASERGAHRFRAGLVYGAIGGALAATLTTALTAPPGPKAFTRDPWSLPLAAGIVSVHVLDFASTRYFRNRNKDEWLLTNSVVDSHAKFLATEAAAAAAGLGLLWILHRTGHYRLERFFAAGYISIGVASAIANYRYPTTGHGLFGN